MQTTKHVIATIHTFKVSGNKSATDFKRMLLNNNEQATITESGNKVLMRTEQDYLGTELEINHMMIDKIQETKRVINDGWKDLGITYVQVEVMFDDDNETVH